MYATDLRFSNPETLNFESGEDLLRISALDYLVELLNSPHAPSSEFLPQLRNQVTRQDGREYGWSFRRPVNELGTDSDNLVAYRSVEISMKRRALFHSVNSGTVGKTLVVGRFANARLVASPFATARDKGPDTGETVDTSVPMANSLAADSIDRRSGPWVEPGMGKLGTRSAGTPNGAVHG